MVTVVTKENFKAEVLDCEKPVLVDFWAVWCGPCKMISPVVNLISEENDDFKVCKVDVDAEPTLARKFRVMSIPTLIAMQDGQVKATHVGYTDLQGLKDLLK